MIYTYRQSERPLGTLKFDIYIGEHGWFYHLHKERSLSSYRHRHLSLSPFFGLTYGVDNGYYGLVFGLMSLFFFM